jgi:hypothetical protein
VLEPDGVLVANRFALGHQPPADLSPARLVGVLPLPQPDFDHAVILYSIGEGLRPPLFRLATWSNKLEKTYT